MKHQYFTGALATLVLAIAALLMGDVSFTAEPVRAPAKPLKTKCEWTEASCKKHFTDTGFECSSVKIKPLPSGICECSCADPGGARKKKEETPGVE